MRDPLRLIDANANRATEAARTLEDLARFVLDDGPLAKRFKLIRHDIESTLTACGMPRAHRASARDTASDAGVANSASDTHTRHSHTDIASAAGSRLAEALRVLEESLKLILSGAAESIETIRYRGYEAERELLNRLSRPSADWTLCVLITESLCLHADWLDVARAAIEGGADCIQLREKSLGDRELLRRARELVDVCRDRGASVMINDRPDIAALSDADGVHLGQTDMPPESVRRIVGSQKLIGVSCSSVDQAIAAVESGADCIGIGAMFDTRTKVKPSIAGPVLLAEILADSRTSSVPHLAIGGIDASRVAELAAVGCRGVAVSGAVCGATDPAAASAALLEQLSQSAPSSAGANV